MDRRKAARRRGDATGGVKSVLDDLAWLVRHETRLAKRTLQLIEDIRRNPFEGPGKPEPLKGELSGWWSRRIDSKHRLVYRVVGAGDERRVEVVQCRRGY